MPQDFLRQTVLVTADEQKRVLKPEVSQSTSQDMEKG